MYEVWDQLIVAIDEGYINSKQFDEVKKQIDTALPLLNGYINYLLKAEEGKTK